MDDLNNLAKLKLKTGNDFGYLSFFTCRLIYCAFEFIIWNCFGQILLHSAKLHGPECRNFTHSFTSMQIYEGHLARV